MITPVASININLVGVDRVRTNDSPLAEKRSSAELQPPYKLKSDYSDMKIMSTHFSCAYLILGASGAAGREWWLSDNLR